MGKGAKGQRGKGAKRGGGRGRGRPTSYRAEFAERVVRFMGDGYSLTAFAGEIGVARDTVYTWGRESAEFSDALTRARAARTLYWERRLRDAGRDTRAVIFALRNACGEEWREAPDVQVHVNNSLQLERDRPEEWGEAEILAELRRRGALPAGANVPVKTVPSLKSKV